MSKKKKAAKAAATHTASNAASNVQSAYEAVRESPYLQRAVTDDELRDNVKVAYDSARAAYDRLAGAKKPPKAVLNDKKLHSDLAQAASALRDIGNTLVEAPKNPTPATKKKRGFGRTLLLLLVGGGVALAVSGDLRTKVLDLLFGAEEEFDYTSSTTPATPPPAPTSPPPAGGGVTAS